MLLQTFIDTNDMRCDQHAGIRLLTVADKEHTNSSHTTAPLRQLSIILRGKGQWEFLMSNVLMVLLLLAVKLVFLQLGNRELCSQTSKTCKERT